MNYQSQESHEHFDGAMEQSIPQEPEKIFRHITDYGDVYEYRFVDNKCVGFFVNGKQDMSVKGRNGKELNPSYENYLRLAGFLAVSCPYHSDNQDSIDKFCKNPLTTKCRCSV